MNPASLNVLIFKISKKKNIPNYIKKPSANGTLMSHTRTVIHFQRE